MGVLNGMLVEVTIRYPNMQAIEDTLKSDVRNQRRVVTQELVKMFDGRIFQTVFAASHYSTT